MAERPSSPVLAMLALAGSWESRLTAALQGTGLTTRKYGLLAHVAAAPDLSFSALARLTGVTVQTTHASLRSLAAAGFVEDATAHAGAASALRVTGLGRATLEEAEARLASLDAALAAEMPALTALLGAPHESHTRL